MNLMIALGVVLSLVVGKTEGDQPDKGSGSGELEWVYSNYAGVKFTSTEVTVAQFRACADARGCELPEFMSKGTYEDCNWGHEDRGDYPINYVTWDTANEFCRWAGGRLPAKEEWRAESSAGGTRVYPWGAEEPDCSRCVMDDEKTVGSHPWVKSGCGEARTWPVCSKPAGKSASGLCDMAGNVAEHIDAWESNPKRPGNRWIAVTGGGFDSTVGFDDPFKSDYFNEIPYEPSQLISSFIGFRCVREAPLASSVARIRSLPEEAKTHYPQHPERDTAASGI